MLELQRLGGWSDLQVVRLYVNMVDDDLLKAARSNAPLDRLMKGGSGASKPRRRILRLSSQ